MDQIKRDMNKVISLKKLLFFDYSTLSLFSLDLLACLYSFSVITSSTCTFTSTTFKPVMNLICSLTTSLTLLKTLGALSPYSKITFRSIAACFRSEEHTSELQSRFDL